ncbi:GNAT family N-acetyltransferase [Intrasporangium sp. YIM S08009]|uniref:GNAT family N-acetyltransferase n=1 Tax=Intrasporangium zincisolvens TaxID=3080018 RepID=UPI002B06128C|nr:GNAT family N-acetyltransferase [Intrasporangium sp. YIM S08009]
MRISVIAALSGARTRRRIGAAHHETISTPAAARAPRPCRDAAARAIQLRRLTPTDAPHMTDLLQRLSPQSRYLRYFRPVRSFAPADIARFVATSHGHLAVGAFDAGVLVGVAQYFRSERPDRAEVALEVADSHHRRGLGARLVHELARLAAEAGITHFTATVLAENLAVLGLVRRSGWEVATTVDGPYTDIVVSLPSELVSARATCQKSRAAERPHLSLPGQVACG